MAIQIAIPLIYEAIMWAVGAFAVTKAGIEIAKQWDKSKKDWGTTTASSNNVNNVIKAENARVSTSAPSPSVRVVNNPVNVRTHSTKTNKPTLKKYNPITESIHAKNLIGNVAPMQLVNSDISAIQRWASLDKYPLAAEPNPTGLMKTPTETLQLISPSPIPPTDPKEPWWKKKWNNIKTRGLYRQSQKALEEGATRLREQMGLESRMKNKFMNAVQNYIALSGLGNIYSNVVDAINASEQTKENEMVVRAKRKEGLVEKMLNTDPNTMKRWEAGKLWREYIINELSQNPYGPYDFNNEKLATKQALYDYAYPQIDENGEITKGYNPIDSIAKYQKLLRKGLNPPIAIPTSIKESVNNWKSDIPIKDKLAGTATGLIGEGFDIIDLPYVFFSDMVDDN